jgi:hypothetical protein
MSGLIVNRFIMLVLGLSISGCATGSRILNPFYEDPQPEAHLGEDNDRALNDAGSKEETARKALEAMTQYRSSQAPQPVNPVLQPAVVRLMWVPDHLNRNGDLVPAHYYYLKVLGDRWAVQDSFELEQQLNGGKKEAAGVPFSVGQQ